MKRMSKNANPMDNLIGINRSEWFTPIYRFTTVDQILHLIEKGQNTLTSPRKWDDPFENILRCMTFTGESGRIFKHPLRDRVYGQCWTTVAETDTVWRTYIPDGKGVRLKTSIRKLHHSLVRAQNAYAAMSCFIGRVEYKTQEEMSAWFSYPKWVKEHLFKVGSRGQAESLLFKRKEFEPEQEIRLIYLDPQNIGDSDFFSYPLQTSDVIEQITFDPRMKDSSCETYDTIIRKFGYSGQVDKSKLYQIPDFKITV